MDEEPGVSTNPARGAAEFDWVDRSLRLDRKDPYLRIQFVTIFVRDVDRSIRFFVDQLGFSVVMDARLPHGERRVAIAPPDGSTLISLRAPEPGSKEHCRIGEGGPVVLFTEDVSVKFQEWSARGIRFQNPPQTLGAGGPTFVNFEDVDGNSFTLAGFDELTRALEARRREIAEKLESERRATQELEIAKQVQARLFPQMRPALRTLEYTGVCLQARQVGGDYYDFLDLGAGRLGLVIGDISGKGIGAALLMANLQANLRSQSAIAWEEPRRLLQSANQLFYENTADSAYASLFFAEYDDLTRRLRYASCGHLPGFLLRPDGSLERLDSTGTVLGLFKQWDCSIEECLMSPGDLLALYSDGITESFNTAEEEFGEQRLIDALWRHRNLPAQDLLTSIVGDVREFSRDEQHDDVTLIVATCRALD